MQVSALMGLETMQTVYAHAIAAGFRFYSYADASLLLPGGNKFNVDNAQNLRP